MPDVMSTRPLLDKLGVRPGARVAVIGIVDPAFTSLLAERTQDVAIGEAAPGTDLVFLAADSPAELSQLLSLRDAIAPSGAIWVVSRKGRAASLRDVDVIEAARSTGLVDNKVVAFSATHTALRLVIPVALRPASDRPANDRPAVGVPIEPPERPRPGPHRTTLRTGGGAFETLSDLPPTRDRLLFVGLNPSPVSVAAGHYHQGRLGRTFWRRLIAAGILPPDTALETADDALVAAGHGITDLLKRPTERDVATRRVLTEGVGPLWQKVSLWRPAAIVFIYKRAAEIAAGRTLAERWGRLEGVALAGRPCFLMPGPYAPRADVQQGVNLLRNLRAALPD